MENSVASQTTTLGFFVFESVPGITVCDGAFLFNFSSKILNTRLFVSLHTIIKSFDYNTPKPIFSKPMLLILNDSVFDTTANALLTTVHLAWLLPWPDITLKQKAILVLGNSIPTKCELT